MKPIDEIDYFTDASLLNDPYPYFEVLRETGPVCRLSPRNLLVVTGHKEATTVYNNAKAYSSIVAVTGPIPPLPFEPEGDDITPQIERHRSHFPFSQLLATMDDERHAASRSLLLRLFTPLRLRENEAYMRRVADEHIDAFIDKGRFEVYSDYSHPFAGLVIADLLGVPEEDRKLFAAKREGMPPPSSIDPDVSPSDFHQFVAEYFERYLAQRRAAPSDDIFSQFAMAMRADGTRHSTTDVVNAAVILFGAGQSTISHFMATCLRLLGENHGLQQQLRSEPGLIPQFIEEALRFEGPIKNTFRLARKNAAVNDVAVSAGTCVMIANAAVNRDPRHYENPNEFRLGRPRIREHLAFGRGAHTCPGAALARAEARISLERMLERLRDIRICETNHGPPNARRYEYEPTYLLRGLRYLHLEVTAA